MCQFVKARKSFLRIALIVATFLTVSISTQFAITSAHAAGTTYYVSTSGSDSNNGTATSTPFKTIQKCASVAVAGDSCLIMAGTYDETVTPANSGTSSTPITFAPYNGASVTIDGADPVTGWSLYSGNIYQATVSLPVTGFSDTGFFANQVFVDGTMTNLARWPATGYDPMHQNDAIAASGSGQGVIKNANIPNIDWTGATVYYLGNARWTSQTGTVTSSSAGQVNFSGGNADCHHICPTSGVSFYLVNALAALTSPGEWYYNGTTLYLWTPSGDSPANHTVEAKERTNAFNLSGRSYIDVTGFTLHATTITTDASSTHDVINGITATYVSEFQTLPDPDPSSFAIYAAHVQDSGIILNGSYNTLENSAIAESAGNGVSVQGSYNTVTNNLIHDVDYEGTYDVGIYLQGDSHTVMNNTVYDTGRDTIAANNNVGISTFHNNRIAYNNLFHYALIQRDLGGIYVCCSIDGTGSRIDHNWIHDSYSKAAGIHLDNYSSNFEVDHNVVWNAGFGNGDITFNRGSNNLAYNNTLSDSGTGIADSISVGGSGDVAKNNIFGAASQVNTSNNLPATTNPEYVDPATRNYQLQSTSPAIDVGVVIAGITDGYVGSAPDEGAYEYGATAWTAGCALTGCQPGSNYPNVYYKLVNVNSGKVLDNPGDSQTSGTLLDQWTDTHSVNQEWSLEPTNQGSYKLINRGSGLELTDPGSSTTKGTQVDQEADNAAGDNGSTNAEWHLISLTGVRGNYTLVNRSSGYLLDVSGSSTSNGAKVIQWVSNGGANQQWQLVLI